MAPKAATTDVSATATSSLEKRKAFKMKKEKSKVQNAWLETVSRTRDRNPLPSLHLKISLTEISRHGLARWTHARKPGNENIEVVRTKSQAGMRRPRRLPTIYKSNSRLFIDQFEAPVPEENTPPVDATDSEKCSVMVDLPESVQMRFVSETSEKYSVVVGIPNTIQIRLSPDMVPALQSPSRFEELNDDASVHELEAVHPSASLPASDAQTPTTVILCEADDPTALPTLEFLQQSFTMGTKQHRPKISVSIPRSKSLHVLRVDRTSRTTLPLSPHSPPSSTTLHRSLTQVPTFQYSIVSPLSAIDMPKPVRPYSTISVPLFMEASDLAQPTEEVPPLPIFAATIAETSYGRSDAKKSHLFQEVPAAAPQLGLDKSGGQEQRVSPSSPSPSDEADIEDDDDPSPQRIRTVTRKTMAESINKPLPPEPRLLIPTALPALAYKPRYAKVAQAQETLPRSKYAPIRTGKCDELKKHVSARFPHTGHARDELEWRLSSVGERCSDSNSPRPTTPIQVSRKSTLMQPSRPPPPVHRLAGGEAVQGPRQVIVRSSSASHVILSSGGIYKTKTRSWQDLKWSGASGESGERTLVEEPETWYRTASERSSAYLSQSVFSDAGTDGTCQTEQSNTQEKAKEMSEVEKGKGCVIDNAGLPQAMQASRLPAQVAETVILRIMSNLMTLRDLFATAALNKGFYNTFKRHEMYLIKTTLFKSSPAAWELREIWEEKPATPTAYLRQYSVEIYTMGMLKSLVLVRCESFLRPTTIAGLVGTDQVRSGEIDAAFWRVWTFCRLFGSSAGEEEDIESQIDWLNGGQSARRRDPSSPCGIGNGQGLSKSELYDMSELWTCLSVLLQTFHGRVSEARAAGIYEGCKVDGCHDEELLLEEWTWYLLTVGPSCILALAPGSFSTAKELGLTDWAPPAGPDNSRSKFFKKALTRVYEARLVEEARAKGGMVKRASKASDRMTEAEGARVLDRARQTAFAQELRSRRQQSPTEAGPWTFSDERPMSVYSQVVKSLPHGPTRISAQDLASMPKHHSRDRASPRSSIKAAPATSQRPQSPVLTSSTAIPSAEDEFPASLPSLATTTSPPTSTEEATSEQLTVVDPTDRAMAHMVEVLGFDKDDAKWALRRSETGHGLDMERAIEILVSGSPVGSRTSSREGVHPPVEVESSIARPNYIRKRTPVRNSQQRDSVVVPDEMTQKQKDRANIMRMREKSYRVLGIGTPQAGKKFYPTFGKRFSWR